MEWNAKWIWSPEGEGKNQWICFRKTFTITKSVVCAKIRVSADSRYLLYINGRQVGTGPARGWPFEQGYDFIDVKDTLQTGENVIAVLVNFYGESTSQYLHGRGGLLAELALKTDGGEEQTVLTDESWLTKRHASFTGGLCRINVAQPWVEVFDASKFDEAWIQPGFDDQGWSLAETVGEAGCEPWTELVERQIPLTALEEKYPKKIMEYADVQSVGVHACVNVRDNFFPGSTDSVDKGFLGYLATVVEAPRDLEGAIELVCRKSPETPERMKLNGKEVLFPVGENTQTVHLHEGRNFLLIDISGYHQRFSMNYYFRFSQPLRFTAPSYGGLVQFATVGPFEAGNILNIVAIDNALNFDNPQYQSVWGVGGEDDFIEQFQKWLLPVDMDHCVTENPHILTLTDEVVNQKPVTREMHQLALCNAHYDTLYPTGRDQRIILDFGEEISGLFSFDLDAPEGVAVDVDFAECCWQNQYEFSQDMNSAFRYLTKAGRQRYRSYLRRGFRYAVMTFRNVTQPVKIHLVKAELMKYSALELGDFTCSDWELNQIWEISKRSVGLCMEDTYVDCPAFEQAYWIGDGRIEALVSYYTHGAYDLMKRSMSMVGGSMRKSELPEAQVPTGCNTMLTAWVLLWLISCKEYYDYSGDLSGLKAVYKDMLTAIDRMLTHLNKDWLLEIDGWNMLDWAGMDTPVSGVVTHQCALLVKTLNDTSTVASLLGDGQAALDMREKARKMIGAMNRILWSDERNAFIDCIHSDGSRSDVISIQTNIMAYLCGCVEGERMELLAGYIEDPPEDFIQIGSPFMSFFYFEALAKIGCDHIILESIRKSWGAMLRYGSTTCWETFLGFETNRLTRSHCHGWSSAPGFFLPGTVLGVKPAGPGFRQAVVAPKPCGLTWARGDVPTPYGVIHVEWQITDGVFTIGVQAPEECEVTVVEPDI